MTDLTYLSLFSGIGGLDLGLDRAGWTCVGQVELNPFCQRVLAKHWPEVPRHDDVRTAPEWWAALGRPAPDLVAGGFPCQPFSTAGRQLGVADERWGWPWFADVVRVARPRYVLVENVAALLRDRDAFGIILADLAALGYDADWDCVPAAAVGAPHLRDRLLLVAHANARRRFGARIHDATGRQPRNNLGRLRAPVAYADPERRGGRPGKLGSIGWDKPANRRETVADTDREPPLWAPVARPERDPWAAEPDVGRVAHGVPGRVDRLRGLGNAVVPQVAEHIGRLILAHAERTALAGGAR